MSCYKSVEDTKLKLLMKQGMQHTCLYATIETLQASTAGSASIDHSCQI